MTESHVDTDAAFDAGFSAFEADAARRTNPYDSAVGPEHLADAWDDGWFEARSMTQDASGLSYGDDF